MGEPAISAIVVTARGGDLLRRCLLALADQVVEGDEILVSVAGPEDVAGETTSTLKSRVILLFRPVSAHYAEAVNHAAAVARGDLLFILNDDTEVQPGCLDHLRAASRAGTALLQPRILLANPPGRIDNAGHSLFPDGFNWARGRGHEDGSDWDHPGAVGAISGAAFACPRVAWTELGGFDESLAAFGEDADLSFRAFRRGLPLIYVPEARVLHVLGASYGRVGFSKVFWAERNRFRAAVRSLPVVALIATPLTTPARWVWLAARRDRSDSRARTGFAPAVLAGFVAGLTWLPDALGKRRADEPGWTRGEWAFLAHLWRQRVSFTASGRGRDSGSTSGRLRRRRG